MLKHIQYKPMAHLEKVFGLESSKFFGKFCSAIWATS